MSLNGFEETARWHKSIQSAVADGDWGEAGIVNFGDQVNVKYVVDNFKQLYKFEERLLDFKRDLVLHSLDDTASDAYTNNTEYGLVIETPFQKLTDLDSNSIVRKFNLRYNSIDDITLEFYVDGDASTVAKTITIPASSTLANNFLVFVVAIFKYIILSIAIAKPNIKATNTIPINPGPPSIKFCFNTW